MCSENIDKYVFIKLLIVIEAVKKLMLIGFSLLAQEKTENAQSHRKDELLEISNICSKVPMNQLHLLKKRFNQFGLFN